MNTYLGGALALAVWIHIAFFLALRWRRNDLADVFWGPGFLVVAIGGLWARGFDRDLGITEIIILFCLSAWALRLAYHVGARFRHNSEEDVRYKNWRNQWGRTWLWRSYLQVFLLQGVILILIALPILKVIDMAPRDFSFLVVVGVIIWLGGFIFEFVSDKQLREFKADLRNKGRIMDRGLWSWSRHPNYFGEVVQWWGFFIMAFSLSAWWLVISPLLITFMILKVSGVSMLEELMDGRPGIEDYRRKTSVFIPMPPKH